MNIDRKLLNEYPVLSDYAKDLIKRIGINHETQARVAKFYKKSPAAHARVLRNAACMHLRSEPPPLRM